MNANADEKEKKEKKLGVTLKTAFSLVTTFAMLLSFTAATYAWFSSNSVVSTDRVSGRTGTDNVTLEISRTGGNDFSPGKEAPLTQVNGTTKVLMPVSTADLRTFVSSPSTIYEENTYVATYFERVTGEKNIYHGRVYLRANAQGQSEDARLALYLDGAEETGGNLLGLAKGYATNAARLGLTFEGGNTTILRVSEESNPTSKNPVTAKVNSVEVKAGQVINGSVDPMQVVADPSVPIARYVVGESGLAPNDSVKPLLMMELNRIYAVDVYLYLEGCDPDCSDVAKLDSLNLHLAFYGVLTEGAY